ncbi:hypothetical protein BSL78_21810 [Apostichopus japonicus]|uniref:Death domain-containing protein n=1 Tax=Stichopus japonicus TaxID=307972 RepID=A0A2G8K014_STIJA|nr:hypothetical protein BSL78_21810 [Apostichopus japonicus]
MASQDCAVEQKPDLLDGLDEVVDEKDLQILAPEIADSFNIVTKNLGLSNQEVFTIKADNAGPMGGVRETAFQALMAWKRKNGENATKKVLIDAFEKSDRGDLAVILRQGNR